MVNLCRKVSISSKIYPLIETYIEWDETSDFCNVDIMIPVKSQYL